jgi:predicted aspartyl protease
VVVFYGVFTVKAFAWNPQNPEKRVSAELVVDTGATYTTLPTSLAPSLLGASGLG